MNGAVAQGYSQYRATRGKQQKWVTILEPWDSYMLRVDSIYKPVKDETNHCNPIRFESGE